MVHHFLGWRTEYQCNETMFHVADGFEYKIPFAIHTFFHSDDLHDFHREPLEVRYHDGSSTNRRRHWFHKDLVARHSARLGHCTARVSSTARSAHLTPTDFLMLETGIRDNGSLTDYKKSTAIQRSTNFYVCFLAVRGEAAFQVQSRAASAVGARGEVTCEMTDRPSRVLRLLSCLIETHKGNPTRTDLARCRVRY